MFFAAGWFSLPAGYTQPPVMRSFSVQAGRPILIPLVNQGVFQFPAADVTFILNSFTGNDLIGTINHVAIANLSKYIENTGIFSAGPIVPNTIGFGFRTPGFPGVPPDCSPSDLCPSGSVGDWLMLDLSPGVYVIDTGGTASVSYPVDPTYGLDGGGNTFSFSTDYTITVTTPEPASTLVLLPGLLGLCAIRRALRRQ